VPTTDDPAGRRVSGAIRPSAVDNLALVRTAWDIGAPLNTVVWYFRLVGAGEIRVIDIDRDLDIGPVERVARILVKGYFYGSHFLPHDALATQKIGRTFLTELKEAADVLCGTNASNSSNASFQPVLVMSDILIAAIGVPMWIVTLPGTWSSERYSKRSSQASSIVQLFRAF
jgi:hypothetical protein